MGGATRKHSPTAHGKSLPGLISSHLAPAWGVCRGAEMERSVAALCVIAIFGAAQLIGVSGGYARGKSQQAIICKGYSGDVTPSGTRGSLTGCSGNTGGSGIVFGNATTIFWANSTTTSFSFGRRTVPPSKPTSKCPASTLWVFPTEKGHVTADTTGSTSNGAKVKIPTLCEWWISQNNDAGFQTAQGGRVKL